MSSTPNVMMAFACEKVSTEPGKPISFENMLDGIEAADFPAPSSPWFAIFCFYDTGEKTISNCRVLVEHESGELVGQMAVKDLQFAKNKPISRNIVAFRQFTWPYPGWYDVKFVAGDGDVLAVFPMLVQGGTSPSD